MDDLTQFMIRIPSPLKKLFLDNDAWPSYVRENVDLIRPSVIDAIVKLLACGTTDMGFSTYQCIDSSCGHWHVVPYTCHGRFCPSCGKKATDQWIATQQQVLPQTGWQHIVFTMPDQLWPLSELNRWLLPRLNKIAADAITSVGRDRDLLPGVFTALHTFGRDLKWNAHIHVSVTTCGLTKNRESLKPLYFPKNTLRARWKYGVIKLLRDSFNDLVLPPRIARICRNASEWSYWLDREYRKNWVVHCSKGAKNHYHNVKYLGSYIKRPPIAMSKLLHYSGSEVLFAYFDHKTKTKQQRRVTKVEFIQLFTQHIPEKHQRLINYYGFLANRVRGKLLPKVHEIIGQQPKPAPKIRYPALLKATFGFDPMECLLCKKQMILVERHFGKRLSVLRAEALHQWCHPNKIVLGVA